MPGVSADPPAPPPKHRRSFSGIRNPFGLSNSPSLPAIGISRPSLTINTPNRPSTSNEDLSYQPSSGDERRSSAQFSTTSSRNASGLRTLGAKFFATPTVPSTPRSVSAGSGAARAFMGKLAFGTLSRSNSKTKIAPELVSPFATPARTSEQDDDLSPVMQISAVPSSPMSFSSEKSLPTERQLSPISSSSTPYYPPVLVIRLPRSPSTPLGSRTTSKVSVLGADTFLAPPGQTGVHPDIRSSSPSSRSLRSMNGTLNHRGSRLTIEQSRISEHTEPDSSIDASRPSAKHLLVSSPLRSPNSSPKHDLSSEGEISRDLFDESNESLTNLIIPPIPKSSSLALDENVPPIPSPLPSSASSRGGSTEPFFEESPGPESGEEEFVSAPPSARSSMLQPVLDADLATLLSPNRFGQDQDKPKATSHRLSLQASTSSRVTVTPLMSSTPLKRDAVKRMSRTAIKPIETWAESPAMPSSPESPTRAAQRRSEDRPPPSPRQMGLSSDNPSDSGQPPSPSPLTHRRRGSVTHIQPPAIRPSLVRAIQSNRDKPPVAGTRKDYHSLASGRPRSATAFSDRYGSPDPSPLQQRPSSRTSPRRAESPVTARSYSSLSTNTYLSRARRAGVEEVFSATRSTGAGHSHSNSEEDPDTAGLQRSRSVDLMHNPDGGPLSGSGWGRPSLRPASALGDKTTERLGPSSRRAFEEAGLVDHRDGSLILPNRLQSRPNTARSMSPLDRPGVGARRSSDGRLYGPDGFFNTPMRSSSDTARPDSVSGFTSSSNDHISHSRNASSLAFHPSSPVSSGRTLYSTSTNNNPYAALQDKHELEKDALLMALGENKRKMYDLQEDNDNLRTRNRELHAYALELERKVANLERVAMESASPEGPYSSRVIRRRAPITISPEKPEYQRLPPPNFGTLEPPVSRRLSMTPKPRTPSPPSAVTAESPSSATDRSHSTPNATQISFLGSMLVPSPAPIRRGHRRASSNASSVLPTVDGTMSMLMNEQEPANEGLSVMNFTMQNDADNTDADDDEIQRFRNALLGASTATATATDRYPSMRRTPRYDVDKDMSLISPRNTMHSTTSPTESSFAYTSAPASPGSMVLRTEDEIHLDDLMSLREDSETEDE